MNLVEEKQRGLIPPGLQSWRLSLIDLANTTSVVPPPAGPAGCRPLYLLHWLNLSFTIWSPNWCCILQFRAYQSLYATSLVLLGLNAKFLRGEPKALADKLLKGENQFKFLIDRCVSHYCKARLRNHLDGDKRAGCFA